jgi:NhaP-type Na+/H+ or K+/H+ antiporter
MFFGVFIGPDGPFPIMPRPSESLGGGLQAIISLGVAIILFEGGLSLNLHDIKTAPKAVRNLLTVGAAVSFIGATAAAHFLAGFDWPIASIFGTLMIVTGPTVIGPILKSVRLRERVHTVLMWESIIIDTIGAISTIILFEAFYKQSGALTITSLVFGGLIIGPVVGVAGGMILGFLLKWRRSSGLPVDEMEHLLALAGAFAVFGISEAIVPVSGLAAVIVAGIVTAHVLGRHGAGLKRFKGTLTMVFIGVLFMLLAADFSIYGIQKLFPEGIFVVLALIFVIRPANIFISAIGTRLELKERVFIGFIAPRGIVAASVATIVAVQLAASGEAEAGNRLVTLTFMCIFGTVVISGALARPLAYFLDLKVPQPQGILIIGINELSLTLAEIARMEKIPVTLADTNLEHCEKAVKMGFAVVDEKALDADILPEMSLNGIGSLIALTGNPAVDGIACLDIAQKLMLKPYFVAIGGIPPEHFRLFDISRATKCFAELVDLERASALIALGKRRLVRKTAYEFAASDRKFLPIAAVGPRGFRIFHAGKTLQGNEYVWGIEFEESVQNSQA